VPNIGAIPSFANLRLKGKERRCCRKTTASRKLAMGANCSASRIRIAGRRGIPHLQDRADAVAGGSAAKTILFTSAHSSEGKTVSATNTAAMFAQTGARVLLIDGDLRKARCHRVLALENSAGLTEVRPGPVKCRDVIRTTIVDGLSFMSAGSLRRIRPNCSGRNG